MAKGKIILFILIFVSLFADAQEVNFLMIDSLTYKQYLNEDWKELIKTGKEAKRADIEYYYLDLRLGYAYFQRKKYFKSAKYFEKAYKENPDYEFTQEFLYYSYLDAGLEKQSNTILRTMSDSLKADEKISDKIIKGVSFEFSYFPNLDYNTLYDFDYLQDDNLLAYLYLEKSFLNYNFGVNFQLSKRLSFDQNFEFLSSEKYFIKQTLSNTDYSVNLSTWQMRDNGVFSYDFGKRWLLNLNYNIIVGSSQYVDSADVISFDYPDLVRVKTVKFKQFSVGVSLEKQWWLFKFKPSIDLFKTYDKNYIYPGLNFTFYPLGNTDLYFNSAYYYSLPTTDFFPAILSEEVGFRLWRFNFFGVYYYGEIQNFVENDGHFIYNFNEVLKSSYGGGISYQTNNKTFYITALPSKFDYQYYNLNSSFEEVSYFNSFNKILFKGGLKWKF